MGGICLIGECMKNLSELIAKHEEIYGDQSERITSLPTMTELRMTEDEKRKKQKMKMIGATKRIMMKNIGLQKIK